MLVPKVPTPDMCAGAGPVGGGSTLLLVGGLAAAGIAAFFLFGRK
jgi:hypothetical protein